MSDKSIAIILAAGLGTRMRSNRAKVLHEVAGRPLIIWAVEAARNGGADTVVTVLGHQSDQVGQVLANRYGEGSIRIALQPEQNGTGHATACALPMLEGKPDDAVVVISTGDAPLLRAERIAQLTAACRASSARMSVLSTYPDPSLHWGRMVRSEEGALVRIVEHRDATAEERKIREMNAAFYAFTLGDLRTGIASLTPDNAQGELYLTDLVAMAAKRGRIEVIETPFEEVYGINDRVDLAAVDRIARRRINEQAMRAGVTMLAPDQIFIDADVGPIGRDVWLGPNVILSGTTQVGEGARIGAGCVLHNVQIAPEVEVKPHSVLSDTIVESRAQIGPFTHCRPGTQVGEGARLGNFVETKKTHLMAGAKANHHAYLGDASVGAGANIGAGTITCNYDGFQKSKTTIEAGAFIGSDTQLVAPVTVGRDAYVGAGSTVTKDVPRSSLALTRTKQVNVDGWADRFRQKRAKQGDR